MWSGISDSGPSAAPRSLAALFPSPARLCSPPPPPLTLPLFICSLLFRMRSQFPHLVMTGTVTEPKFLAKEELPWHKDTGKCCVEAVQALRGREAVPAKHTLEPTCLAGPVQDEGPRPALCR